MTTQNLKRKVDETDRTILASVEITRSANTTAYAAGKLINSGAVTVNCTTVLDSAVITPAAMTGLLVGMAVAGTGVAEGATVVSIGATTVTLSAACTAAGTVSTAFTIIALPELDFGIANQGAMITELIVVSDNGAASVKLNAIAHLWSRKDVQASLADAVAFAPTYAMVAASKVNTFETIANPIAIGTAVYEAKQIEIRRRVKTNVDGKLFVSLIASNAATPKSGERFKIIAIGYFL